MWQCPHCGARQPESGRCWVCHRSSTCCATCANFRSSLVGGLGYCALDRTRQPLRGSEMRGCWEAAPSPAPTLFDTAPAAAPAGSPARLVPRRAVEGDAAPGGRRALEWVPVDETDPASVPSAPDAP
jgi:hypothetical protein